MGNPKQFLENFQKNKKDYFDNKDLVGLAEHKKKMLAEEDLVNRMKSYMGKTIEKYGINAVLDALSEKFAKNEKETNKSIYGSLEYTAKSLPDGNTKGVALRLLANHKDDPNVNALIQDLKPLIFNSRADEAGQKMATKLEEHLVVEVSVASRGLSLCEALMEKLPPVEDTVLEEEEYLNVFEKELLHPAHDKVEELLAAENKKAKPDKDLIQALKGSDEIIAGLPKQDSFASTVAESQGEMSYKVFDQSFLAYQKAHKGTYVSQTLNADLSSADKYKNLWNQNMYSKYEPAKKFKDTVIEMIEYGRKNGVLQTDPDHMEKQWYLSSVVAQPSMDLEAAINENNPAEIKRLYALMTDKTKHLDYMVDKLKAIDDKHLYNSNMASSREVYYPAKYRLDYEGATLFNQIAYISDLSLKYNIPLEEIFTNPVEVPRTVYKNALSKDGPTAKVFQTEDPFALIEDGITIEKNLSDLELVINNFAQYGPCMSINSPENREACFNTITVGSEILRKAYSARLEVGKVFEELGSHPEVIATMLVAGKDFDVFTMVNTEVGRVDLDTLEPLPPFELSKYIEEKGISNEDLMHTFEHGLELLEEYKGADYEAWYQRGVKNLGNTVSDILSQRLGCEKSVVSDVIKDMTGEELLSNTEKATAYSKLKFKMMNPNGVEKKNITESIKQIAALKKEYDTHNWLAKIFIKSVRDQGTLLTNMKNEVMATDYVKAGDLKDVIEELNRNEASKENSKFEALSELLDEKALFAENKVVPVIDDDILLDADEDEPQNDFDLENVNERAVENEIKL